MCRNRLTPSPAQVAGATPARGFMKKGKTIELTDIYMLRMLVKQANGFGATLRVRKSKKYPYIVCGQIVGNVFPTKMGGTAAWLYDELLSALVRALE